MMTTTKTKTTGTRSLRLGQRTVHWQNSHQNLISFGPVMTFSSSIIPAPHVGPLPPTLLRIPAIPARAALHRSKVCQQG